MLIIDRSFDFEIYFYRKWVLYKDIDIYMKFVILIFVIDVIKIFVYFYFI